MGDICGDNRFELVEKYKKKLIESTNIETSPEEMKVLDNILFRFWQMGWLDKLELPSAQPDQFADSGKMVDHLREGTKMMDSISSDLYEYHYDHTDCIWYRPEARNRCPSTCAQYRDGWNDAMQYIFRDGKGYRPYRRGERYE